MADEEQIILPERFIKVDYIQSVNYSEGTCYIDTGVKPNQNTGFYVDFEMISESSANTAHCIFGSRNSSQNKDFQFSHWSGGILRFGTSHQIATTFSLNYRYQASLRNGIFTHVTGANYNLPTTAWQGDYNIYLFSLNQANSCIQGGGSKIYRFKLYDGDTLIRDFVPAYDTYNLSFCMYDLVNQKAHRANGTGKFTSDYEPKKPSDEQIGILHKLPEGFTKVNYLIANGSQYIDTNYVPTNETGYYVEGQGYTTSETYFFGMRENNSTNSRICAGATPNVLWGWMTNGTLTSTADYLRQETVFAHNFLNSRISKATINGTDFTYNLPELDFTPTFKIHLFGYNRAGSTDTTYNLKGRIDTFLISEGDQIVRQFIPCLDADGIPCMYELYTGTAHYNQGSGNFSYPRVYTNEPINLPAGYTKCAYLQSNGTQWIETQFIPNGETGLYLKVQHMNNGFYVPFGSGGDGKMYYVPFFNTSNKACCYAYGQGSAQLAYYYDKGDDLIFTSTMNLYNDRTVNVLSEDTEWHGLLSNTPVSTSISLWLFSWNKNTGSISGSNAPFGGRIFRAKITQGDYLAHDFVPCLDANDRPCMYDLITQTPFYNQSGGEEFAYCVEHQLPSDFIKLNYLESTGTQYIKTGYVPTNNTGLYIDAYNTVVRSDWTQPFSLRETNGNTYVSVGRVNKATNGAAFGWGAYTSPGGTGDNRYEATLNWLNDKKSIITAPAFAQRVNTLSDLPFTPTFDLCMFGIHYYDGTYNGSSYRIYRAKISEGTELIRDYVPAYDELRNKPCMYDLINNVAYYNDGTGEFVMPPKREGSYTGFAQLGGIGNRLGCLIGDELPGGYVRLNYIESTGTQKIVFDYEGSIHTGMRGKYQQTEFPGEVTAYAGVTKEGTRITLTNVQPKTSYANPVFAWGLYAYYYNTPRFNSEYYGIIEASTNWMEDSAGSIWFDGKTSSNVQTTFTQDGTYSGITIATGKYKHYWYKISEGQNVVRNFVPCLDIYGVPCMYETITQQAFYNVGSGEYLYG